MFKIMITNAILFVVVVLLIKPIIPTISSYAQFVLNGVWVTLLVLALFIVVQGLLNLKETKIVLSYLKKKTVKS